MTHGICSICSEEGRIVRGWCLVHYQRWMRSGDPRPLTPKRIFGDDRARFESYVDRSGGPDACHLWTGTLTVEGYGQITIKGKRRKVHRFGWELYNEPISAGEELDHECHNEAVRDGTCQAGICSHRRCCNNKHLVPRTKEDHSKLTSCEGLRQGSSNGRSKLDENMVREIKTLLAVGDMLHRDIAKYFGVSTSAVDSISTGRNWSHVT